MNFSFCIGIAVLAPAEVNLLVTARQCKKAPKNEGKKNKRIIKFLAALWLFPLKMLLVLTSNPEGAKL